MDDALEARDTAIAASGQASGALIHSEGTGKSSEFGENGVCGFGPQKGFCGLVVLADIGGDGVLEIGNGFEDAAPDAPAGDGREEALDGIEPGRGRRREVKDPSWVVGQPGAHLWLLVGGIVVEDGMDNLAGRHGALDGIEEANEFAMPVLRHIAAEDGTVEHVKGGEQRRDAIALIIVRHGPAFARLERQTGLGPVERLDLRFLVDRQHNGVGRRIHVETDDVLDFLNESRIGGPLEGAQAMRLQPVSFPDRLHCRVQVRP